jgi:hypothetical protein
MEHIPAIHAAKVGMRYPAVVLDVYPWGLTLYFDLTKLAPGRSPRIHAYLFFQRTLMPDTARELKGNDRVEVVLIEVSSEGTRVASLPAGSDWLTWNNGTVRQLARRIRETSETVLLPVLADALEEAGCTDATLLDFCRQAPPDAAQGWMVELLATQE